MTAIRLLARLIKPKPYKPRHACTGVPAPVPAQFDLSQTQPFPVVPVDLGDLQ